MPEALGARTRSTRQAAAVLAALSAGPSFSSAREVHDTVRRHVEGIGIATVYRHLRMLTEHGSVDIVRGLGGEARYRLRNGGITCLITCKACGRAIEADAAEVLEWARKVAADAGFTLTGHMIELAGICPDHAAGGTGDKP